MSDTNSIFTWLISQEDFTEYNHTWKNVHTTNKEAKRPLLTLNLQPASLKGQHMPNTGHWSLRCRSRSSRAKMEASHWLGQATGKRPHFVWCTCRVSATNSLLQYRQGTRRLEHSAALCCVRCRLWTFMPHLFSQYIGSNPQLPEWFYKY